MFDEPRGALALTLYVLCALTGIAQGHPYDTWAAEHFGSPLEVAARTTADPDRGGDTNLLEFALGTDPEVAGNRAQPVTTLGEIGGELRVILRYPLRSGAVPYLLYGPQASTDLVNWESTGGPLELVDEVDPDQTPAIPGFQWRRAHAPAGSGSTYLRLNLVSLTELWQRILEDRDALQAAAEQYSIVLNIKSTEVFDIPKVRQFLPSGSRMRTGSVEDLLGNPFIVSTLAAGVQIHPATVAFIGAGAERALHPWTWDTLGRELKQQQYLINSALNQFSIENNKRYVDPVSLTDIAPYIRASRFKESGFLDPLGNGYTVGPTIADGVSYSPATIQFLDAAGWAEGGLPKVALTDQEIYQQLNQDSQFLMGGLQQWAIERNKTNTSPVSMADIVGYIHDHMGLSRRNGLDPLGNSYLVGPLVQDGVGLNPATVSAMQSTEYGGKIAALDVLIRVGNDQQVLLNAAYANGGSMDPAKLGEPFSWAILQPSVTPGSQVALSGGLDPLGNPYGIGPTKRDFLKLHPATLQYLENSGVLMYSYPGSDDFLPQRVATQFLNELRILESASDQWAIETNRTNNTPVEWALIAPYLVWSSELAHRGGLDVLGNPFRFTIVSEPPRISHESIVELNSRFNSANGGRVAGNLTLAAHWMSGDLERIQAILHQYQSWHNLPDSSSVTWEDVAPWLVNVKPLDVWFFHREYGFDSLGNRPVIGPTLADPVRINPDSEARILAAGLTLP